MPTIRFHCPECSFGDREVGHLTAGDEMHCIVCLEEEGRLIRLHWGEKEEEPVQARLRDALAA
jgi:hypothetical protein